MQEQFVQKLCIHTHKPIHTTHKRVHSTHSWGFITFLLPALSNVLLVNNLAKGIGEIHTLYSGIMAACLSVSTVNSFFLMGTFPWPCTSTEDYFPTREKSGIVFDLIPVVLIKD